MGELTVIILTFNEARHIARAIDSVSAFAAHVIVVDSYSTDATVELSKAKGASVLQHPFVNQAKQFQWALDNAALTTPWLMRLDADEVVSPELGAEIARKLSRLPVDVVGINLRRRHIWMGRWVRHGGRYPLLLLRIWRRGHGRVEDRAMDEHLLVEGGRTVTFDADFSDDNLNDLGFFVDKHNKYASREAVEVLKARLGLGARGGGDGAAAVTARSTSWQTASKHWIKQHVYNRIPFTLSAPAYFLWRYVFQLGFLDGRSGLVYHFLQGCWYRFLVGAKVMEFERAIAHLSDRREIAAELSRLSGQPVRAD